MRRNLLRFLASAVACTMMFSVPVAYGMEKNIRPAGIVDNFENYKMMEDHTGVTISQKNGSGVLSPDGESGTVTYLSLENITRFQVYYTGDSAGVEIFLATDGAKFRTVKTSISETCIQASDIKGQNRYLQIILHQGTALTGVEVNTKVRTESSGVSGNAIIDEFADFSQMYSYDEGFATNTDKPEEHNGDTTRIARGKAANGASIVYKTPEDIKAIKLKTFSGSSARQAGTEAKLSYYLSKNGTDWEEIKLTTTGLSGTGLMPEAQELLSGIPAGMRFFKISFASDERTVDWSPKLGRMELYYGDLSAPVTSFASGGDSGGGGNQNAGMETVTVPEKEDVIQTFQERGMAGKHPRLLADADDFDRIRANLNKEPYSRWFASLSNTCEGYFKQELVEFVDTSVEQEKKDFLNNVRAFKARLEDLSMMWKLTGEERYAQRAWEEMVNAMNFPTLYPEHYLNVGEGVFAFGIAYDWLYDWMDDTQRAFAEQGIRKQLDTGHDYMMAGTNFTRNTNNWNGVCCGGLAVGALAIMEKDYSYYADFIPAAVRHTPKAIAEMAPAGVYPEGPGYWDFGTEYLVYMISSMDHVLGQDYGLSAIDGFKQAGDFLLFISSPSKSTFNFADSGEGAYDGPQAYWFAQKFNNPICSWYQLNVRPDGGTWDLIYYDPDYYTTPEAVDYPLDQHRGGAENFSIFRSSFDDKDGLYAALKGGDNQSSHGDLDIGTFILDALGQRWASELGAENYAVSGYWDTGATGARWNYYGKRAEGHNTLVINPDMNPDQDPMAVDEITDFETVKGGGYTILDMTNAYAANADSVRRGMMVFDSKQQVLLQDEVECIQPSDIYWSMHTFAEVEVGEDGKSAMLSRNGEKCLVSLQTPEEAKLEVRPAAPLEGTPNPPGNGTHNGMQVLSIHLSKTKTTQIRVIFTPLPTGEVDEDRVVPAITALDDWAMTDMEKAELSSLTVDGEPLAEFSPDKSIYTVQVPSWVEQKIPVSAESTSGEVEVIPQEGVLGQTIIKVHPKDANVSPATYAVRFVELPLTDVPEGTPVYKPLGVEASDIPEPENVPENTLDDNYGTRWAAEGDQWITYDLGEKKSLGAMGLSFMSGDIRVNYFEIQVSNDNKNWDTVWEGQSSGTTDQLVTYLFEKPAEARYIRFFGHGTSAGKWNSITKAVVYGAVERKKTFTDISDSWAKPAIEELFTEGVLTGATTLYFKPEEEVGFADFISWTAKLTGINQAQLNSLSDADGVSRVRAAEVLAAAAKLSGLSLTSGDISGFTDCEKLTASQLEAVSQLFGSGIIKGTGETTFAPDEPLMREQAAEILRRLKEYRSKS